MAKYLVGIVLIILLTGAGYYFWKNQGTAMPSKGAVTATAVFACDEGKSINATFYADSVDLVLSDGRNFSLPHAVSADGARYANPDEAVVFWNKGNTAFITEGGNPDNQTFKNCGVGGPVKQANTYTDASSTFTVNYPDGFTPDPTYKYTGVSAAKPIAGVKFQIPGTMATGTNLGSDTYAAVEQLPRATACTADIYIKENVKAVATDINGHSYSFASTTDAGAGNRYEEWVYAIPNSKPCTAVRYWIHYGNFQNYPQDGSVKEFDRNALLSAFDSIRDSLTMTTPAPASGTTASTTTQ